MNEKIKVLISNLKHKPGCYIMYDVNNTVIYVGKAKDLYKRVSQYFLRPQIGKVMKMVSNVDHFETIIVETEKEALVLEMNLIHKYMPRYNILLKDNSHYPYIAINKKGDVMLSIKRNNKDNKYTYFGPFPKSSLAFEMVDLLNKLFPLRKCQHVPNNPCLYYHLGQCLGPCINKISEETNEQYRKEVLSFLRGNNSNKKAEIKAKMIDASEKQDYESAKEYKAILDSIEHINASQNVEMSDRVSRDIFAFSSRDGYLSIAYLIYRNGMLLGKHVHVVESFGNEDEQVSELIGELYSSIPEPKEIIINDENVINDLSPYLEAKIYSVTKGALYDLVVTSKENANNALDEYFLSSKLETDKIQLLEELKDLLNIPLPLHIDLFDNSHLQGSDPVGAMVSFINGEANKSLYRKFNINHEEARDDVSSMKEVITRHYLRSKNEDKKLPDLILVDGGLTQIHAAIDALNKIGVNIPVFGLFKNDKHQTRGILDKDGKEYLIENQKLFFLLTRMQDEVHRFAISFHKSKRSKSMMVSYFDGVVGLGDKRKELLNRLYPDINKLKEASIKDLEQVLPSEVAERLYMKIHE